MRITLMGEEMGILSRIFGSYERLYERTAPVPFDIEEFHSWGRASGFSVEADEEAPTILRYRDESGELLFCVDDIGAGGRRRVTLEWPRSVDDWTTRDRERIAFQRTKCFLEAMEYEVRIRPSIIRPNQPPLPTSGLSPAAADL